MPKFDTEFIHCMWGENLKGKICFVADSIDKLQERVESNDTLFLATVVSRYDGDYPFRIDNGNYFRFCYHDPYYDLKLAREKGKIIQFKDSYGEWADIEGDYTFSFDPDRYRITPEVEERVTRRVGIDDLPIGTKIIIKVVPYTSCDDCAFNDDTNDDCRICGANYKGDGTDIMFQVVEVE